MSPLTQSQSFAWRALTAHRASFSRGSISELFADDDERVARFSLGAAGLYVDYSKNLMTAETLELLCALAQETGVEQRRSTGMVSYIKVSDGDLRGLFPELDEASALAQLRAWAPTASLLLTRDAEGMQLFTAQEVLFQPAFTTRVIDTVGCGDAGFGGWLASQLSRPDASLASHLEFSAACAAAMCARQGAYAPLLDDVAALTGAETPCIDFHH